MLDVKSCLPTFCSIRYSLFWWSEDQRSWYPVFTPWLIDLVQNDHSGNKHSGVKTLGLHFIKNGRYQILQDV